MDDILSKVKYVENTFQIKSSQQKALDSALEKKKTSQGVVKDSNILVKTPPTQKTNLLNGTNGYFHPDMILKPDRSRSTQRHKRK